ncbi:MAG: hypothetical protein MJB14_02755 [Spirochaetes bacterium]|nr:hypothetical protein [Spirochaetota bacterium]
MQKLDSQSLIRKLHYENERIAVIAKIVLGSLIIVSVLSAMKHLTGNAIGGALITIITTVVTNTIFIIVHFKRVDKSIYRYLIYLLDIIGMMILLGLYSFSPHLPADYGLEHPGIIGLIIAIIVSTGFAGRPPLTIAVGLFAILCETVFVAVLRARVFPLSVRLMMLFC